MNTRAFLLSLVALACAPWKAFTPRKAYKPLLEQVFPSHPEVLPGLYCHYVYGNQVYPYEIVREFDDRNDLWEGQMLANPRRNKWWAKDVTGKTVLICTGSKFNDPETLFFKRI